MDQFWTWFVCRTVVACAIVKIINEILGIINNIAQLPNSIKWILGMLPSWMKKTPNHPWARIMALAIIVTVAWLIPTVSHRSVKAVAMKPASPEPQQKRQTETKPSPSVLKKSKRIPNKQSDEMAREFDYMLNQVNGKSLTEHERKFYMEYACVLMPLRMASICGHKECENYVNTLKSFLSTSKNIPLLYHTLRTCVVKQRFIDDDTPDAGTVFDVDLKSMLAPLHNRDFVDYSDEQELLVKVVHIERTAESSPQFPSGTLVSEPAKPLNDNPPETNKPKTITAPATTGPTRLEQFLKQQGWVQCRKCGQVHYMKYETFASFNTFKCLKCGFLMNTVPFSKKINQQKQRIIEETAR